MKDLKNIVKELENRIDEHEALLEAWQNVKRLHKKDGSDFSVLSKNFENAKIEDEPYSLYPVKIVKVWNCGKSGKYYNEEIKCTQIVRYSKREIEPSRIIKETLLEDRYDLTIDEIFEDIATRIEHHKNRIEELQNQIVMAEKYYNLVVEKMQEVKAILNEVCADKVNGNNLDLRYALEDVVKNYYFN